MLTAFKVRVYHLIASLVVNIERFLIGLCGLVVFGLASASLWISWVGGPQMIAPENRAMLGTASAALLFILFSIALLLNHSWLRRPGKRSDRMMVAAVVGLAVVGVVAQNFAGKNSILDGWLAGLSAATRETTEPSMSLVTSAAFLLTGVSFGILAWRPTRYSSVLNLGNVAAFLSGAMSLVVAAAYLIDTPLVLGGERGPMPFLTALSFVALDFALVMSGSMGASKAVATAGADLGMAESISARRERIIILGVAVSLFVGASFTGVYVLRHERAEQMAAIENELDKVATLRVQQISAWREERLRDGRLLMRAPYLGETVHAMAAPNGTPQIATDLLSWMTLMIRTKEQAAVVLFDHEMKPLLAAPASASAVDPVLRAMLSKVGTSADVLESDFYVDASGTVVADLLAPIVSGENRTVIGAILLRVHPESFLRPLLKAWPTPRRTGETLLVKRENDDVVYLNAFAVPSGVSFTLRRSSAERGLLCAKAVRGEATTMEAAVDYRGERVLGLVRRIPGTPWLLVAKLDQSEADDLFRKMTTVVSGTIVASLCAIALCGIMLWRRRGTELLQRALAAEQEHRTLATRLALVTQHANDIVLMMDENGRILEANDCAVASYGYSLEELRELPPGGLRGPGGTRHLVQQMELFDTAGTLFEVLHQRKDGSTFSVEVSGRSFEIEGRNFNLAIIRDISERKASEEQIARLNRLYAALSQVNQAIVHLRNRETLFPAICQILVEQGGFKMAWIGWRNPSAEFVDPLASFGDTDGYLTEVRICSDDPEGANPVATALREGRTAVCHDLFAAPSTAMWREAAERHGFKAAVALPVRMESQVVGVLSVYADRKNVFVRQEVELLEEAATDLSFALENFEREGQRRQAKAALRQSEEEHRRLFQHHPEAMWVYEVETLRFLSVNDAALRHYGYSREEFLGMTIKAIRPESEVPALLKILEGTSLSTRTSEAVRHRKKDGTVILVKISSQPVQFEGHAARLVFAEDITERVRAEEALRMAHARLRRFVDSNVVGILIGDAEGNVVEVNDYYLHLVGFTRQEFNEGKINWRALTPPEWLPASERAIKELRESGTCQPYEKEYLRRDGTRVPVFLADTILPGATEQFAAFVLDLTARKRDEAAIQQSLSLLKATLESTADGLLVVASDGKISSYNQQFATMWHLPESVLASGDDDKALQAVLDQLKNPDAFLAKVRELYSHPEMDSFDVLEFKDGRIVERFSRPQLIGGRAIGRVWSFRDVTVGRRAQEALRESEHRQRLALQIGHIGAFEFDGVSGGGTFTRELAEIWGLDESFSGSVSDFYWRHVHPEDLAAAKEKFATMVDTRKGSSMELRFVRPDGELRWLQWQAQVIDGADGASPRIIGVIMDITSRKNAEEQLVLLITAILATPTCVVITDEHGAIEWANPAFTTTSGYTLEEAIGKNSRFLKSGLQPDEVYAELWRTIISGRNWSGEFINRRKDGALYVEEATIAPVRAPSGAIRHFVAIKQDITVRKEAERRIREQAELLDKANEAIVVADLDHRITFWNRGAERLFGWSAAEMVGAPVSQIFPLNETTAGGEVINAIATVGDWRGEIHTRNRSGTPVILETSITVLYDEKRRPTGRLKISTDITEKKKLAEQFLRAQRMESVGMLAAGIAHDLNNVLAPIGMASSLLREHVSDNNDVRLLDTLEKCAVRGAGLVRQILGFAHGVSGEHRLVQVKHLLRDIFSVVTETFPKSIVLDYQAPNDLWPIHANATQIHQILLNLCVNARDAMPQGGTLRVGAENCLLDVGGSRALEMSYGVQNAKPGSWLMLYVEDTGTGISPEILPRIWEPFFTTKSADKGTGLGLSTVRGIVETHRGFVTLDTQPDHGTAFRVYLPAVEATVAGDMAGSAQNAGRGHSELILLVDDESLIRDAASAILTNAGYRVVAAADGTAAAAIFEARADEIALVITDRDMPVLDGAGLAAVIRQRKPTIGILAMSGLGSSTVARDGRKLTFADAFLPKPFTAQSLLSSVERLLKPKVIQQPDAKNHG